MEAGRACCKTVEAEHILLAVAAEGPANIRELLAEFGLDHASVEALVAKERATTLAAVGVVPIEPIPMPGSTPAHGRGSWGASAMNAFRRALSMPHGGKPSQDSAAILLALLDADLGTLPRVLALGGVDKAALRARLAAF